MQVLLTADTGIAAHEAIAVATSQGVDVLVTDHHDLSPILPEVSAVVNPKRLPKGHPLHELSGVGVAYQVIRALFERMGRDATDRYLDLTALGLVADVAMLRSDVRYLVQRGLQVLRCTDRIGLREMMDLADLEPERLTEDDIRFSLAPRLNAISRVSDAESAESASSMGVELLTTTDRIQARTIATALEALNARRKWLTQQTTDAALAQLERDRSLLDGPAIVLAGANWEPGIVGVVAGRLAERFGKPAIVFSARTGELARGSARSVEGVDIHAAIAAHRDMLYRCGGHPMAAGLSLGGERIVEFRRALWRTLAQTAKPRGERELSVEEYLDLGQLSLPLARAVQQLSPFGPGNEAPVFATRTLSVISSSIIGRTREHRRVVVSNAQQRQETILWWQGADQAAPEGVFDLAYTIGTSAFRGEETIQLTWVAARPLAPVAVQARPEAACRVRDYRHLGDREAARPVLVALSRAEHLGSVVVWAEGEKLVDVPAHDRRGLGLADTMIVWTAPPDPDVLAAALESTSPSEVVLFAVDPGLDSLGTFLPRLAGLLKHALTQRGGGVLLSELAAAMAHAETTVRLGLEWIAEQGQLDIAIDRLGQVTVCVGQGKAALPGNAQEDGQRIVVEHLQAQLQEAAAYRSYFRQADERRLIT
jgi:single-stranded-DNA-specific exonuclease